MPAAMHWHAMGPAAAALCGIICLLWHQLKPNSTTKSHKHDCKAKSSAGRRKQSAQQQDQHSQQHGAQTDSLSRKASSSKSRSAVASSGASDASTVPQHELKQLQAFLRKVYKWRGWTGGSYHITQAWHAVESAAATAEGGGWQAQFTGRQLTDANCDALLRLIDAHFCAGKLMRRMKVRGAEGTTDITTAPADARCSESHSSSGSSRSGDSSVAAVGTAGGGQLTQGAGRDPIPGNSHGSANGSSSSNGSSGYSNVAAVSASTRRASSSAASVTPPSDTTAASAAGKLVVPGKLRCRVVQSWGAAWLAYFDTQDNIIYINCWRWAKDVSPDAPINCEGVVCVSRLQMLMHTLAHELVHAVVFHLFPNMDRSSPAYTVNNRHGPVFQLLNKQLFGHSSDALEHVHVLPGTV